MRCFLSVLLLLSAMTGCNDSSEKPSPTETRERSTPVAETPEAAETRPPEGTPSGSLTATVQVVDLAGTPLPYMAPIVTRSPNAFDTPVATGSATDSRGLGSISFPTAETVFLRAWDPAQNYFPNNFYEVLAGGNTLEDDLIIQMVPAAGLSVQLILPDNQVAADTNVGLMLYHATHGPWWPAEGHTNGDGFVSFKHLPAGEFALRFKAESGPRLEYTQTALPPGAMVDLGVLTLQ